MLLGFWGTPCHSAGGEASRGETSDNIQSQIFLHKLNSISWY